MLIVFTRTVILYALVVIVMRLMGKRQVGELQPFELVVAILIADLSAVPMQNMGIPLLHGVIPILTLLLLEVFLSVLTMKNEKARGLICGTPSILVEKGQIKESELKRLRLNLNDLMEQLRTKNYPDIADVEYAILETNGELSVIPKPEKRPVNPQDLQLAISPVSFPVTLILDGKPNEKNIKKAGKETSWLMSELQKKGIRKMEDVLFATIQSDGTLFVQKKDEK